MLATAAVASADSAPVEAPQPSLDTALAPPGMTEPVLMPPGMTPPVSCQDEARADRDDCDVVGVTVHGGIVRGGFGHYFWTGGG
jgi:hypothetical protein